MRPRTPWLFLLGSRSAILDAAAHWPMSLLIGALLVLSAGLARNYDDEDLRAEPLWLLGPYAASLATSAMLFGLYWLIVLGKQQRLPLRLYVPFVGLYWLTAPLAWLYAVPYEMFLSPVDAIYANAGTLAVVALWRVALMARVAQVLLGCSFWAAFFTNLWFGVAVIWIASFVGPKPVLDVMGGLRLSEVERAQSNLAMNTIVFGMFAAALLLIPAIVAMMKMRLPGLEGLQQSVRAGDAECSKRSPRLLPLIVAVACVLMWAPLLAWQQHKVRNQRVLQGLVESQKFDEAALYLSTLQRTDLSIGWNAPSGTRPNGNSGELAGLDPMPAAIDRATVPIPGWVRRKYVELTGQRLRFLEIVSGKRTWLDGLERVVSDSNGMGWVSYDFNGTNRHALLWMAKQGDVLSERERAAIQGALKLYGIEPSP